jgi:Zn-dependent membrane protease YugP
VAFYLVLFVVPLVLGFAAQAWVKRAFTSGSKVESASGLTGAEVSRRMLDAGGLTDVGVEDVGGTLSDHYDPRGKMMRLSEPVGRSSSVAAVAVAAHETGHAFQDAQNEAGFRFRNQLAPGVGFVSNAWFPLVLLGFFANASGLILLGAAAFAVIVLFQLATLPVEFGASRKAMAMLTNQGVITPTQVPVARRVLTAAALTYIVAALISIVQLAYLLAQARR